MNYKQVLVIRADLKMSPGKMAAQAAHASHSAAERSRETCLKWYNAWRAEGQKKVVVKVADEDEMISLYNRVKLSGLPFYLVNDAGLTELPPGTITALGIGPGPDDAVDRYSGQLKLL